MFISERLAYKDILEIENLAIPEGKITCVVGESGGGKTTLLRLLAKLISPTEGVLRYKGDDVETLESVAYRKEVILLSQKPFIFEGTVKDNLEKGATFHGKSLDNEEMERYLKKVDFVKPLETNAAKLSGGESQRLALARVMVLDAAVILLDEPSSALDEETEKLVIDAIVDHVRTTRKTLVMVTHSRLVAAKYADVIYTIERGKIKGRDTNGE